VITAVISDLHLGTRTGNDLLGRPDVREALIARLQAVDHVVLLGDSIELRDGPPAEALEAAVPFFEVLGEAMAGRRVTIVAGNHDHQLASAWLARRPAGVPLGLEELSRPRPGDLVGRLAARMGVTEVFLAYPGVWLRPDVYATHGHYLDCHNRALTFECLACAAMTKARRVRSFRVPDDYEAVVRPVYGLIYRIAQSRWARGAARTAKAAVRWSERRAGVRTHNARAAAGLDAMGQVVDRLGIDAQHVVFGHLHHPGQWERANGRALVNAGSWVIERDHRPGTYVIVREEGSPELNLVVSP
jgi:predicted phosphodiesterase